MLLFGRGSRNDILGMDDLKQGLFSALDKLGARRKVLAVPPDITRIRSQAGTIIRLLYDYYGKYLTHILPAIGTHAPMSESEISTMFGDIPQKLFQVHRWRKGLRTLEEVPGEYLTEISENRVSYSWPVQVNFNFGNLSEMLQKYHPKKLKEGKNILNNGEEVFFISNPALGLWAVKEKFYK